MSLLRVDGRLSCLERETGRQTVDGMERVGCIF